MLELSFGELHEAAVEARYFSAGKKAKRQERQTHRREKEIARLTEKRQAAAQKMGNRIIAQAVESSTDGEPMVYELSSDHRAIRHYDLAARSHKHRQDPFLCLEDQRRALADLNAGASGTGYEITGMGFRSEPAFGYDDVDNVFVQFTVEEVRQEVDAAIAEAINA